MKFEILEEQFKQKGFKLEKFKGFYGIGYYILEIGQEIYNDWKFISKSLNGCSNSIVLNN